MAGVRIRRVPPLHARSVRARRRLPFRDRRRDHVPRQASLAGRRRSGSVSAHRYGGHRDGGGLRMVAQASCTRGADMNPASAQQLWSKLASAGVTVGDMPEAQETHTPWYVRLLLGIAGFIAAVFLLGFVGVGLAFVLESKIASLAAGFMMIAAAYAVFRAAPHSDFGSMFALAVSFTGQALVVYGVWGMLNERSAQPWVAIAAIEAILALFMPNFIHRRSEERRV